MTVIAKTTRSAPPAALDRAGATVARAVARRVAPRSLNRNSPSLVIVVPDPPDAIAEAGAEAGLKGGSKLLWTLGAPLPLAV